MMRGRRAAISAGAGAVVVALVVASAAWACTGALRIETVSPASESPASSATVRGSGAGAGALVELRFNSTEGPLVGNAVADVSGGFEVNGTIPTGLPTGIYTLVAKSGESQIGRAVYEVSDPADLMAGGSPVAAWTQPNSDHRAWSFIGLGILALLASVAGALVLTQRRIAGSVATG